VLGRIASLARRWSVAVAVAVAALGLAVGLAACGSSSSQSTAARTNAAAGTSTARSSTAPTATAPTASTTTVTSSASVSDQAHATPASVPPGCHSSQIVVSVGRAGAGLGHVGEPLLFRNTGSATCVLTGYPGVALVKAAGTGQVQASRTPSGYLGGLASPSGTPPLVRVRAGETISALLEGDDSPAGGSGVCPGYRGLLVTPPNQTVSLRVARPFSALCRPQIHPVVAGTSGSQS
jgi:hypothetical protein